jgi:hypothetical protein
MEKARRQPVFETVNINEIFNCEIIEICIILKF